MTSEGAYRCGQCKTHRHLLAWAAALIEGPLGADGNLAAYDYVDECFLHEDSIHCTRHLGAPVEMFLGGRWRRWWSCSQCRGGGVIRCGQFREYKTDCQAETPFPRRHIGAAGQSTTHEGWLPVRKHETATAKAAADSL